MKKVLVVVVGLGLLVCSFLLYGEAVVLMRGDYILVKWIGIIETNKSWAMVFWLAVCGGSLTYIAWKLPGKLRKK